MRSILAVIIAAASIAFAAAQSAPPAMNFTGNPLTQKGSHMIAGGPAPTISAGCGTGATVTGSDVSFRVLTGSTTSQPCTVTFAESFTKRPTCTVTSDTATASYSAAANGETLALTSLVDLTRYNVHCIGHP